MINKINLITSSGYYVCGDFLLIIDLFMHMALGKKWFFFQKSRLRGFVKKYTNMICFQDNVAQYLKKIKNLFIDYWILECEPALKSMRPTQFCYFRDRLNRGSKALILIWAWSITPFTYRPYKFLFQISSLSIDVFIFNINYQYFSVEKGFTK